MHGVSPELTFTDQDAALPAGVTGSRLVRFLEREGFEVLTVRTNSLLLHHLLEVWRNPEPERDAMYRSAGRLRQAVRRSRLLKLMRDATNALLAHWHVGDTLRVTARKQV